MSVTKTIRFIEKDQDYQNECTRYWFSVDSENWAISDKNGELTLLDSDGCPVEECNDFDNIKGLLTTEYEKHIND